jgi:hypothetical protein
MATEKKRTVQEIEDEIKKTPQQQLPPLLAELEEAKQAEQSAKPKNG